MSKAIPTPHFITKPAYLLEYVFDQVNISIIATGVLAFKPYLNKRGDLDSGKPIVNYMKDSWNNLTFKLNFTA